MLVIRTTGLLLGIASVTQAQLYTDSKSAWGSYSNDIGGQTYTCGSANPGTSGAGTLGGACSAAGASYDYLGSTVAGLVKTRALVSGSGLAQAIPFTWGAHGDGTWADRLTITSGAPAILALTVGWDGTLTTAVNGNGNYTGVASQAVASWSFFSSFVQSGATAASYSNSADRETNYAGGQLAVTGPTAVNDIQTFYIPLGGATALDFRFFLQTYATISGNGPTTAFDASAAADFGHTGKIEGLVFENVAGQDITGSVGYSFANGTLVYAGATVPEPGTWALLSAGLLGIGAAARRRRPA